MGESTTNTDAATTAAHAFIARWSGSTASELASAQSFVIDLCELLGVDKPHPTPEQSYMFERPITFAHGDGSTSPGRIDCYRRGHFVLEAKKFKAPTHTKGFDDGLLRARSQAEGYARALPATEGRPPFVLVVDVGNVIEVYAEFSQSGATYTPYPDPRSHRLLLADLARPEVRERLRRIWCDPDSLNPARISAQVTRDVAALLARLSQSLEASLGLMPNMAPAPGTQAQAAPEIVAAYLTRCLFSMFAEDVELLPKGAFQGLLQTHRGDPVALQHMLRILWADMDRGGFCAALAKNVLHFNGKLFKGAEHAHYSLLLSAEQIDLLIQAARANWREVEPAIFGTLLERALDPTERHALGAHYTPRAYVERLVQPTVIAPLRQEWEYARAAALVLAREAAELEGKAQQAKLEAARAEVLRFHHRLCTVRVLDPACGSANFLYVTLEHLKRLEGEVINQLQELGTTHEHLQGRLGFEGETVTLQQLRGIELNERAAALAELVLWIGYLQWHIRTRGHASVATPVVHNYGNIECRDALLAWDAQELAYDDAGRLLSRWDGRTFKTHPVTGEQVPDEAAQVPQWRYVGARQAQWPQADFIVGNPPYLGARTIRQSLGAGYLDALRKAHSDVPENADFVMYWWNKAAALVASQQCRQFGLITTNSLRQSFNRVVLEKFLDKGLSLTFAIPDHPWVDSSNGAAVRVALSVGRSGKHDGTLGLVTAEEALAEGEFAIEVQESLGHITPGLTIGIDVAAAPPLVANRGMSCVGYQLTGKGFVVDAGQAHALDPQFGNANARITPLLTGRDITQENRGLFAIDSFGLSSDDLRTRYPAIYQWLFDRVKPERDTNSDRLIKANWWLYARTRDEFRLALNGCNKAIATSLTAKHRTFVFVPANAVCDSTTVMFALPSAFHLGILSSKVHVEWSLASNNRLGVGNDPRYIKTVCFENFPFPDEDTGLTPQLRERIAQLAEQIDAHRKRVLAPESGNTGLTLTGLYNVLTALREGRALTTKEKTQHAQGLVGVLRELHDELDAAVLQAYGLGAQASTDDILAHLVQLNTQRAQEEAQGRVRWLRPDFQNPQNSVQKQELLPQEDQALDADLDGEKPLSKPEQTKPQQLPWPATLPEQVRAVAAVLAASAAPLTLPAIEARFKGRGPWKKGLPTLLQTLEALGRAQHVLTPQGTAWR
ncbi:class I SAM-dependent DNA methyltransferase [Simplicispira sedimenti]|uniref:class I SAM-dependent DNA methyltransferase n=1 Tax=Simplicispira sedimenti TaxID=2919500 RepID=UPI001FAA87BA|nr:DNA methyltransferase [Acidovorax sp. W1-6]